jgi:hypothetical protein
VNGEKHKVPSLHRGNYFGKGSFHSSGGSGGTNNVGHSNGENEDKNNAGGHRRGAQNDSGIKYQC